MVSELVFETPPIPQFFFPPNLSLPYFAPTCRPLDVRFEPKDSKSFRWAVFCSNELSPYYLYKRIESPDEKFLKAYKIKSVLSEHVQMDF